ncbi:hypothetical protein RJ55_06531 [Drechmeria coniospora]|nr:hypothetical protein RJ55_06531 [Drechmeria coniospora]
MPIVNHVVLASGAVVAVSVVLAAAAVYENPELRRYADDIRRRIAIALHCIGDGIDPPYREPRFNRPEDADGFMQSRRGQGAMPGVDADDETRRRQREELLYWNQRMLERREASDGARQPSADPPRPLPAHRGSSFDDFLHRDAGAEQGAYVFNSGADVGTIPTGLRNRADGARWFPRQEYVNPFADEYGIDNDGAAERRPTVMPLAVPAADERQEEMSDIYSATTRDADDLGSVTLEPSPRAVAVAVAEAAGSRASGTLERELADDEYVTAGQDYQNEAYASIQAWAQNSSHDFYSPLPETPAAPVSEPELLDEGQMTPTDSISLVGSGEDLAGDAESARAAETGRPYDVLSVSEGMLTPASWSEVGSVISENESYGPARL